MLLAVPPLLLPLLRPLLLLPLLAQLPGEVEAVLGAAPSLAAPVNTTAWGDTTPEP